ncbi:MAG TPA: nicotinate-nucleotide adenylyltransferase [Burkholderiales bacterium]|nr:nicotinate-nucleotide adenylyltransferase [Burkholderiales bacterium]
MAIAILGGTFDPVHNAHLAMAEAALKHLPVEKVVFMPTGNPRYRDAPRASAAHRVAMLKLAVNDHPRFTIDERELSPDATGYTVDTLKQVRADKIYFLMGADQYEKLDSWRDPEEVRKLAEVVVFARPGNHPKGQKTIPFEPMKDSGTEIRARAKRGEDLSGMVPAPVAAYIVRHNLYR